MEKLWAGRGATHAAAGWPVRLGDICGLCGAHAFVHVEVGNSRGSCGLHLTWAETGSGFETTQGGGVFAGVVYHFAFLSRYLCCYLVAHIVN